MRQRRPSPILEAGIVTVSAPLLAFSLYLLLAGHNQPGGGFAGGLTAGVTILLVWSAGGLRAVRRVLPIRSTVLMGAGLVVAVLVGKPGQFYADGHPSRADGRLYICVRLHARRALRR